MKNIKPMLKYFKPYRLTFFIATIVIFITNLLIIFTGQLNGLALEDAIKLNAWMAVFHYGLYFVIEVFVGCMNRRVRFKLNVTQNKVANALSYDTYKKAMNLPAYAYEDMSSGEIINRISHDTASLTDYFNNIIYTAMYILSSIILFIYILTVSYLLAIELLLFMIIYAIVVVYYTKKIKEFEEKSKKVGDKFASLTNESVRGFRDINTLGIKTNLLKRVTKTLEKTLNIREEQERNNCNYDNISIIIKMSLEVVVLLTCALLLCVGKISVAFFVAMTYYVYRFTYMVDAITDLSKIHEKFSVSSKRINEILNNDLYEDVAYGNIDLKNIEGVLEFKNVTFNYKNDPTLLKNFSLKFEPNKKIAIVGPSGEGKSTIFNLLTRIFDPVKGEILLDGYNTNSLTEESLRRHIAVIRQEPFLFNLSIIDNFKLIDEKITLSEIRKYCKLAYIDDYIMSLPKKYSTILGEGGVNLSGGQKQRLAIARTLLKKSKVILFDEATSALDNESQEYVKKSIDNLAKDHTVIIVAHRLSTIIDADIIHFIKDGKVYASGTHAYLMKKCSYYKKLYEIEEKK